MTTQDTTYQGWTNYETWNVDLWLNNDQSSYNHWRSEAQDAWDEASEPSANARLTGREPFTREQRAAFILEKKLKEELDDLAELPELPSFYSDLLNAALSEVNWLEIAKSWLEDVDKTEEDEDEEEEEDDEE